MSDFGSGLPRKSAVYAVALWMVMACLAWPHSAAAETYRIGASVELTQPSGYVVGFRGSPLGNRDGCPQTLLTMQVRAPDGCTETKNIGQVAGECKIINQRLRTELAAAQCGCGGQRVDFTVRREVDGLVVMRRAHGQGGQKASGGSDDMVVEGEINPRPVLHLMLPPDSDILAEDGQRYYRALSLGEAVVYRQSGWRCVSITGKQGSTLECRHGEGASSSAISVDCAVPESRRASISLRVAAAQVAAIRLECAR